jgi:hypothetical protein
MILQRTTAQIASATGCVWSRENPGTAGDKPIDVIVMVTVARTGAAATSLKTRPERVHGRVGCSELVSGLVVSRRLSVWSSSGGGKMRRRCPESSVVVRNKLPVPEQNM